MKKIKTALLLLVPLAAILLSAANTHAALPQNYVQNAHARESLSLNGQWNRIVDPYENGYYNHRYLPHENGYFKNAKAKTPLDLVEYNFAAADKIQVPGDWNTQDEKLFLYEGTIWYHKDFTLKKQADKRYLIHFGAVNYSAIVYVNGEKVGEHEGGFTAFQFDISDKLTDGENFVVVKVDNRRERDQVPTVNTDWWNYGGITRPVAILALPATYLADYKVQLNPDNVAVIEGNVALSGDTDKSYQAVVLSIPELNIKQNIALDKNGKGKFSIAAKPQLWEPGNPKLYDVELAFNGEVIKDRIGFRTIATRGEDIELNGKSIYLRGISIHEESPFHARRAWSEDDARTLLRWTKDLGANFVRLAHYPHNETMVRMADEMGLLVWSEIPVYWTVMFEDKAVYAKAEKQLVEMITRDKNRASVILWSMANETPIHKDRLRFIGQLIKKTRELDNTRLITAAMDTQTDTETGKTIDDPLAQYIDVIGINSYCGWYYDTVESCANQKWHSKYNKPLIMSEFGAGALQGRHGSDQEMWTEEYQALLYKSNLAMIDNITALRGVTPWILKDFRSPRRPLPDIQDFYNRKGLLSETGIRKQAWYVLNDFYKKKQAQGK